MLSTDTLDGALSASSQVLVIIIEFLNLPAYNNTTEGTAEIFREIDSNIICNDIVAMSTQQSVKS